MEILARKTCMEKKYQIKNIKDSLLWTLQPHIYNALQKWVHATQGIMASPLEYNTQCLHCWSSDPRDILFGAHHESLPSKFSGIFICHPIYDDKAMTLALRHAIYSAILNTEATTTFVFLPARDQLGKLTYNNFQSWPSQEIALPQQTWDLQIIAIWNTAARVHLNNQNPSWLQGLAKDIPLKGADWKSWAYADGSRQVQDGKTVIGAGVLRPMSDSKNLVKPNGAGITNTIGRAKLAAMAAALTHEHAHTLPQTASAHFTNS
eukprot:1161118-Pelagomonas_calceolata.AAC.3